MNMENEQELHKKYAALQKELVVKNRELEIEASLERVRSVAMAMRKPGDLLDICNIVYTELQSLGFSELRNAMINIHDDEQKTFVNYDYSDEIGKSINPLTYNIHPVIKKQIQQVRKANDAFSETIFKGKDLESWKKFRKKVGEKEDPRMKNCKALYYYFYSMGTGAIGISTFSQVKGEKLELLKRFRNVFALLYQRYTDIALAEAQAREAQIEAALERARTQSMIMQHSKELDDTLRVFHEQVLLLNINSSFSFLWLPDEEKDRHIFWAAWAENNSTVFRSKAINYPLDRNEPATAQCLVDWKSNEPVVAYHMPPAGVDSYFAAWKELIDGVEKLKPEHFSDGLYYVEAFMKYGCFGVMVETDLAEEEKKILSRFAIEFERAYTRFLDLQKAEAQSREAQVELALERVRARTMAMHQSTELADTASVLFEQIKELGFETWSCGFCTWQENDLVEVWMGADSGGLLPPMMIPYKKEPAHYDIFKASLRSEAVHEKVWKGKALEKHYAFLRTIPSVATAIRQLEDTGLSLPTIQCYYAGFFKQGYLLLITKKTKVELHDLTKRFANVFEQTYTRFFDLQKAEAQGREAEIELALERVRARTMAMQKSEELAETSFLLFEQFKNLGETSEQISIGIFNEEENIMELYSTLYGSQWKEAARVDLNEPVVMKKIHAAWKKKTRLPDGQEKSLVIDLAGNDLKKYNSYRKKLSNLNYKEKRWVIHIAFFSKGVLTFSATEPHQNKTIHLLERFARVFDGTYTRFLDLQKAEAQVREAEIELALERVRARTMAMQHSEELADAAQLLYKVFGTLGINTFSCGYMFIDEAKKTQTGWFVLPDGVLLPNFVVFPLTGDHVLDNRYKDWKEKKAIHTYEIQGQINKEHHRFLSKHVPPFIVEDVFSKVPDRIVFHCANFSDGYLLILATEIFSPEEQQTIIRFAKVFEMTYTRFLDLQKAEAQAREAQIEAALERVRSKTMAMHKSEQLAETAEVFFDQFDLLGKIPDRMSIGIINEESKKVELWVTDQSGNQLNNVYFFSMDERTSIAKIYAAWKENKDTIVVDLTGKSLGDWLQFVKEEAQLPIDETKIKGRRVQQAAFFSQGFLLFTTHEPVADEIMKLLARFAKVFDHTYTRFLDLQKAEAQTRAAKIEAALERVRAQTMAMNKSQDLQQVVSIIFGELDTLQLKTLRGGIGIINGANRCVDVWATTTTNDGYEVNFSGNESIDIHPMLQGVFAAWQKQEDFYYVLKGEDLISYYNTQKGENYKIPDGTAGATVSHKDSHYYFCTFFSAGGLFFFREIPFNDELIKVIRQFANAFGLAYKRFEDLKQSEARALEAVKESSLNRVRAEIASMRSTQDLQRITPLIWRELTNLGVPFFRCGVFIIDESREEARFYLSAPDGHSLGVMNLPFNVNSLTTNSVDYWRKGLVFTDHWNKEEFLSWMQTMIVKGQIKNQETYQDSATAPDSLHLHLVPFTQGMLYVGNSNPLPAEKIDLIKSLAEAFSIAYARYEDFNKLELAKQQTEKALIDLKQAQSQLIQSEKMASLGELTAGIAHEIQNPLNFVNNFSELNKELLAELKDEIGKGNTDEVKAIADDIITNEEKINHHGKRADAIVKGMLQHSQASAGQKELTDINKLADEYLRLAYHGLRAKDKTFNSSMKTNFDAGLSSLEGKVNVIPQDIGRVFLNLITNAFYTVNEKQKALRGSAGQPYEPTVSISTKTVRSASGDLKVLISVKDNGNGIPQKIADKIFHPFFTTKPTGQGTGLGLSLSYDIIKAHGGEIKVETKEGEGSEFIIQLPVG